MAVFTPLKLLVKPLGESRRCTELQYFFLGNSIPLVIYMAQIFVGFSNSKNSGILDTSGFLNLDGSLAMHQLLVDDIDAVGERCVPRFFLLNRGISFLDLSLKNRFLSFLIVL